MVKKLALYHVCAQISHYAYSGFWPIWAYFCPNVLRFFSTLFFLWAHQLVTFRDQSPMLGEHLSQFSPQVPTYIPFFGQKRPPGGKKNGKKNFWAKYSKLKNRLEKKNFLLELQELEVRICVQPNFPIIILILNGFHKFAMSMESNTSSGMGMTMGTLTTIFLSIRSFWNGDWRRKNRWVIL